MTANLSLENRLALALEKRGDMRIGRLLSKATSLFDTNGGAYSLTDEQLVLACEEYVKELETDPKEQS